MQEFARQLVNHYVALKHGAIVTEGYGFDIKDIAHSLSNISRTNGWFDYHYSVAEHCLNVTDKVEGLANKRAALLHDLSEAYIGDCVRVIKYMPGMEAYRELEHELMKAAALHYNFEYPLPAAVDLIDKAEWENDRCSFNKPHLSTREAELKFLQRFQELYGNII